MPKRVPSRINYGTFSCKNALTDGDTAMYFAYDADGKPMSVLYNDVTYSCIRHSHKKSLLLSFCDMLPIE